MKRCILYLECATGISGDMTVASLLDLGASKIKLLATLDSLNVAGYGVSISRANSHGVDACSFDVVLEHEHDHDHEHEHHEHEHEHEHHHDHDHEHHHHHEHRNLADVTAILNSGNLTPKARELALKIFGIVAEEAAGTAEFFGSRVKRFYDVGIAGIHRLFACIDEIRTANAVVAIAGMEGALGGVIAGLVSVPVVAVPTSVGYGASFKGVAPLLTMLNSCAEGMSVVNIDNGFGAGYLAARINTLTETGHPS